MTKKKGITMNDAIEKIVSDGTPASTREDF